MRRGALWLDVRYPSEYQYDKLPGAINVPLAEVRNMFAVLDRTRSTSPTARAAGAAPRRRFFSHRAGFKVWLLEGGLEKGVVEKPENFR